VEEDSSSSDTEDEDEACADDFGMLATEAVVLNHKLEVQLSNNAFVHSCGFFTERRTDMAKMETALAIDERPSEFNGIIIDTGANRLNIVGLQQYQ